MAESMIAGLLRERIVRPENIVASHPRENRRRELSEKYAIKTFESNAEAVGKTVGMENSAPSLMPEGQRDVTVLALV